MLDTFHPKYAFLGYGVLGLCLAAGSFFLSAEAEIDNSDGDDFMITQYSSEYMEGDTAS